MFLSRVPLSPFHLIQKNFNEKKGTVLDIGCGQGLSMQLVPNRRNYFCVGIDIFMPYIEFCKTQRSHDALILCDAKHLPFREKSFDIVFCFEVIEHLLKVDGLHLINQVEKIAFKKIVFSVPVGSSQLETSDGVYDGNLYQKHKSIWYPYEFQSLNYHVESQGLRIFEKFYDSIKGRRTLNVNDKIKFNPSLILIALIATLLYPVKILSYFIPNLGAHMICTKQIQN
tara:strand:- start:866 stop:1546 length:681 start_codon:yes stop_codon:yes gene_type:complete